MDPAPDAVKPQLTEARALALFERSDAGRMTAQPNTTTTVRFGLFRGNGPNPTGADHRLTGSHPVGPLPAWLILVDGIEVVPIGPSPPPGSSLAPRAPVRGYALAVFSDDDGRDLIGVEENSGSAASTGIQ
jgi:hypothetical protein